MLEAYDKAVSLYEDMYRKSSKTVELDRHEDAVTHALISAEEVLDALNHPTVSCDDSLKEFWKEVKVELSKVK